MTLCVFYLEQAGIFLYSKIKNKNIFTKRNRKFLKEINIHKLAKTTFFKRKGLFLSRVTRVGREGQEAMNPVENLRTLWNGLRTPWKVSDPRGRGGAFLKKT